MQTISLDEAKTRLVDLVEAALNGEEVFITNDSDACVRLVPSPSPKRKRQFGSAKGLIEMMPGFDDPLEDFKEYME